LAELGGTEGEPFSGFVDGDEVYVVLGDAIVFMSGVNSKT